MKKFVLALSCSALSFFSLAQNKPGYMHVGLHAALPQNGLKEARYDDGGGLHFGLMSRGMTFKAYPQYSLHGGFGMDFDWMNRRKFEVALNTPVPDKGTVEIYNSSFGFYGILRNQFEFGNSSLYGDFVFGGRSYNTSQQITAKNPLLNPEYESSTTAPDVVITSKPQVGIGGGLLFKLTQNLYSDVGFTYCVGPEGLVQPLGDIVQEGNEIRYTPRKADTDILLIRGSLILRLNKPEPTYSSPTPQPYEQEYRRTEPNPYNPPARQPESTPKKSLEVKPNSPPPKKKVDW